MRINLTHRNFLGSAFFITLLAFPGLSSAKERWNSDPYAEDVMRVGVTGVMQSAGAYARAESELSLFKIEIQRSARNAAAVDGSNASLSDLMKSLSAIYSDSFSTAAAAVKGGREASSGMASGLSSSPELLSAANEILSSREAGSGMATGRRMEYVLQQLEKSSAAMKKASESACVAALTLDSILEGRVTFKAKEGAIRCAKLMSDASAGAGAKAKIIMDRDSGRSKGFARLIASPGCSSVPDACAAAAELALVSNQLSDVRRDLLNALGELAAVVSNPMYQESNNSGSNPIYEGK